MNEFFFKDCKNIFIVSHNPKPAPPPPYPQESNDLYLRSSQTADWSTNRIALHMKKWEI